MKPDNVNINFILIPNIRKTINGFILDINGFINIFIDRKYYDNIPIIYDSDNKFSIIESQYIEETISENLKKVIESLLNESENMKKSIKKLFEKIKNTNILGAENRYVC